MTDYNKSLQELGRLYAKLITNMSMNEPLGFIGDTWRFHVYSTLKQTRLVANSNATLSKEKEMSTKACISKVQFDYVTSRIDSIRDNALKAKKQELMLQPEHKLTHTEAAEIVQGLLNRISMPKPLPIKDNYYLHNAFDFSNYESEFKYDEIEYNKFKKKIQKEARQLKDRLILCGAEDALEELTAFEHKYLPKEN